MDPTRKDAGQPKVTPPHCPECKAGSVPGKPVEVNSAVELAAADGSLLRFTSWCKQCGCIFGMLTMPGAPAALPQQEQEPNPFAPPDKRILA